MLKRLLIANRGEIAVRVARAADDLGIETVAVYAIDDAASGHVRAATRVVALESSGPRAYLDIAGLVALAKDSGCDSVHPGYGFLSENADFARACEAAGLIFVGPTPETLVALGDKANARRLAQRNDVPLLSGTVAATSLADARDLLRAAGCAIMIKAIAGGGGRGIRIVRDADALDEAFVRAQSEARAAFGNPDVYVEEMMADARHIEVQIVGDGQGDVTALGERECSLQRRHQKLVEMAPSPSLHPVIRRHIIEASVRLARALDYRGLGTFEFLVDATSSHRSDARFVFIEANPRVQVEHTVTEAAYGVDLVQAQLRIAGGASLTDTGLAGMSGLAPSRAALQVRINAETIAADGAAVASAGHVTTLRFPSGPGVRVDTHLVPGMPVSPAYDSLVAKVVVSVPLGDPAGDPARLIAKARRALAETEIGGLTTGLPFVRALLDEPAVASNNITTRFIDAQAVRIASAAHAYAASQPISASVAAAAHWTVTESTLVAPVPGSLVSIAHAVGARVSRGATLAVVESMKMEHLIEAKAAGLVRAVHVKVGDVVALGQPLFEVDSDDTADRTETAARAVDLDHIRADLREVIDAHRFTHDANRLDAVAKRHKTGMRTARENLDDLLDPGSFIEYGALAVAAQRARRTFGDLQEKTPADGLITGLGTVNAAHTTPDKARVAVMAYDYMVLAGTQGKLNHRKSDRLLDVAAKWKLPLVLFAEGGGGRPGDTDHTAVSGLDCTTFHHYAALSGVVPVVGLVAGRCFAGNAALLGCSDVIIATENSSIGMGGPAMIEGGGLGSVAPDDVGPVSVNGPNGVIDILVKDETEAVTAAKRYLSYVQGARVTGSHKDQRLLRHCIPENRLRVYDIHSVIETLADESSVLELRAQFGRGAVTAFIRIAGKPFGLIANNPKHLGGAIDAPACDKLARFLQLCDAYGLPVVSLCDTPGFMVGQESEKAAMVRKTSRLFVIGAALRVPMFTIVLRKGYGLGAMGMAAGMFHAPMFNVSWPSGEFGPMGLEGAVRLGYRKELEAAAPEHRDALFKEMVAKSYARGKASNMGAFLEIDAVIDPADTRRWILRGLDSAPLDLAPRRAIVDPW